MGLHTEEGWHGTSGAELHTLAERYNTPYFLYNVDEVARRIELVRQSIKGLAEIYYAVKANPNLQLLRRLRDVADGLDVSSGGELRQACLAGFPMSKISFAGPAKTQAELTESIEHGVGCISIESLRELTDCIQLSRQLGRKANIVVRVNPQVVNRAFGMKMGGKPVQFGVDEEDLNPVLTASAVTPRRWSSAASTSMREASALRVREFWREWRIAWASHRGLNRAQACSVRPLTWAADSELRIPKKIANWMSCHSVPILFLFCKSSSTPHRPGEGSSSS